MISQNKITPLPVQKIIRYLILIYPKKSSILQISKTQKLSYNSTYKYILSLQQEQIISITKGLNGMYCTLTPTPESILFASYIDTNCTANFLRQKVFFKKIIQDIITSNEVSLLLLFGSYAKGLEQRESDIDLLAVTEHKTAITKLSSYLSLKYNKEINILPITSKEWITMLHSKERTVVTEAVESHIILFGYEKYWRDIISKKHILNE